MAPRRHSAAWSVGGGASCASLPACAHCNCRSGALASYTCRLFHYVHRNCYQVVRCCSHLPMQLCLEGMLPDESLLLLVATHRHLQLKFDDVGDEVMAAALAHMPCLQVVALICSCLQHLHTASAELLWSTARRQAAQPSEPKFLLSWQSTSLAWNAAIRSWTSS